MTDTIRKMLVAAVVQKVEAMPLTEVAALAEAIERPASKSGPHRIELEPSAPKSRRGLQATVHRAPAPHTVPAGVLEVCSAKALSRAEIVPAVHALRKRKRLEHTTDGNIESAINRMQDAGMLERGGHYGNYIFQTHAKFRTP